MARYSEEFRAAAVERVRKGEKACDVAEDLGVNFTSVYGWLKKAGVHAARSGYTIERRKPAARKPKKEAKPPKAKKVHAWGCVPGSDNSEEARAKAAKKKGTPLKFRLYDLGDGKFGLYLGKTRIAGDKGVCDKAVGKPALEFAVLPDVFNAALKREEY